MITRQQAEEYERQSVNAALSPLQETLHVAPVTEGVTLRFDDAMRRARRERQMLNDRYGNSPMTQRLYTAMRRTR